MWRSLPVRERARFALRDLRRAPGVHRYQLRDAAVPVLVRHGITSSTFTEVFCHRDYDLPAEVARLLDGLAEPSIVDLGGHAGYVSGWLASKFPGAMIVAYEPDPWNAELHAEAIRLAGASSRWRLIRAAASNRPGRVRFAAAGTSGSRLVAESYRKATITVEQRDVMSQLQAADFAKIDIEGGEWAIMADARFGAGGPRAFALEHHPHLCPGPDPRAEAVRLVQVAGYRILSHTYPPDRFRDGQGMIWAVTEGGRSTP